MTTKTDFHSIMELKENFKPKERGWIDQYAAQHKPDGARHGETTGGEPGKRKKQAGACSFQRMQADCG